MLRNMLSRRGLECKGCTDKGDYVKMAFDTQHVAIQPAKALSEEGKEKDEARNSNEANDVRSFNLQNFQLASDDFFSDWLNFTRSALATWLPPRPSTLNFPSINHICPSLPSLFLQNLE